MLLDTFCCIVDCKKLERRNTRNSIALILSSCVVVSYICMEQDFNNSLRTFSSDPYCRAPVGPGWCCIAVVESA